MGVYYIAVNFDKKEWFSPKAVGANIKLRPLICNREFGAALSCLLVGRWHGDRVALAGDSDIEYDESYKDIGDIVAKEVETRIGGKFVPCSLTTDDGIVFKEDDETPSEIEAQTPVTAGQPIPHDILHQELEGLIWRTLVGKSQYRIMNALRGCDLYTVADIIHKDQTDGLRHYLIRRSPGFGKHSYEMLLKALAYHGIKIKSEEPPEGKEHE